MACSWPLGPMGHTASLPPPPEEVDTPTYTVKNTFVEEPGDAAPSGQMRRSKSDSDLRPGNDEEVQTWLPPRGSLGEADAPRRRDGRRQFEGLPLDEGEGEAAEEEDEDEDEDESVEAEDDWPDAAAVHRAVRPRGPSASLPADLAGGSGSDLRHAGAARGPHHPARSHGPPEGVPPSGGASSSSSSAWVTPLWSAEHGPRRFRPPPPPPPQPPALQFGQCLASTPPASAVHAAMPRVGVPVPPPWAGAAGCGASCVVFASPPPAEWEPGIASEPVFRSRGGGLCGNPPQALGAAGGLGTGSLPCARRSFGDRDHARAARAGLGRAADSYVLAVHHATQVPMNELLTLEMSGLLRQIPADEHGQLTSVGSIYHAADACSPCLFWFRGACMKGLMCTYCHFVHRGQKNKRIRPSKATRQKHRGQQWSRPDDVLGSEWGAGEDA